MLVQPPATGTLQFEKLVGLGTRLQVRGEILALRPRARRPRECLTQLQNTKSCICGKYLKEKNPKIKIWGIDTYGSVFKKYHESGIFDKNEIYPY